MVAVHIINGKVINYTNSGVFDLKKQAPTPIAKISAKDAVARAASYVDITTFGKIELQQKDKNPNLYTFKPVEGWSNDEITAELLFVRDQQDKVKLGWEIQLHSLDENNFRPKIRSTDKFSKPASAASSVHRSACAEV